MLDGFGANRPPLALAWPEVNARWKLGVPAENLRTVEIPRLPPSLTAPSSMVERILQLG